MKAIIYWAKDGGLSNRLRALVGYQALSSVFKVPFFLCWIPQSACNIEFERLFDTSEIKLITADQKQSMEDRQENIVYSANRWFSTIWDKYAAGSISWDYFREQVVDHTKHLRPLPYILNTVDEFSKQHNLRRAAAVHIRSTDNVDCYERWSRYAPNFSPEYVSRLEGFERFITDSIEANPTTKIFLATDNEDVEKYMREIFAKHLITYPKRYSKHVKPTCSTQEHGFQRTTSIEDALVEMLLLGRCRIITGTYWSSYSQFASFWSGRPFLEVRGGQYSESNFANRIQGKTDY